MTILTAFALVIFGLELLVVLKLREVPFGRHTQRVILERLDSWKTTALGKFSHQMRIDSQVSGDIPHLGHAFRRQATSHMLEDDVIELMLENTKSLFICEVLEEGRIVSHLELCCARIETNTSSGNGGGRSLLDATG